MLDDNVDDLEVLVEDVLSSSDPIDLEDDNVLPADWDDDDYGEINEGCF